MTHISGGGGAHCESAYRLPAKFHLLRGRKGVGGGGGEMGGERYKVDYVTSLPGQKSGKNTGPHVEDTQTEKQHQPTKKKIFQTKSFLLNHVRVCSK